MSFSNFSFFVCLSVCFTLLNCNSSSADTLGGLESYAEWVDVTNQSSVGTWTKVDSPNPVVDQGELVSAPAHGDVVPRSGDMLLDFRTEAQYASGGDGANYNYAINSDDFGGLNPSSVSSGTVDFEFWVCPDTWSGDANAFTSEGIYQSTSLLNSNGDVLASLGFYSLGTQNSPEVRVSVDGINWIDTGLEADSSTWTNVSMSLDLDARTTVLGFTDANSNAYVSPSQSWSGSITDTTVTTLNLQMDDGVGKNYYDDFSFVVNTSAVPEPASASLLVLCVFGSMVRRRRRD